MVFAKKCKKKRKMESHPKILFILAQNFRDFNMAAPTMNKKHLVTSFHNLTPELQEEVKAKYPLGFTDAMIRIDKPSGDFFYAVPFETAEISYLVKIDVKIDDMSEDEDDKDYYDDDLKGADDLQDDASSSVEDAADDDVQI